jgi:hypothetical protein
VHPHPIEFPVGLVGGFSRLNPRIPSPREPVESVPVAAEFQKKGEKIKVENEVGLSLK